MRLSLFLCNISNLIALTTKKKSIQPCPEHESCVCSMPSLLGSPPIPPSIPDESHPNRVGGSRSHSPSEQRALPDPNRLAPEDAYYAPSLLKARAAAAAKANRDDSLRTLKGNGNSAAVTTLRPLSAVPKPEAEKDVRSVRGTSRRRRRRKGAWKKLLWVKQSCMFRNLADSVLRVFLEMAG